MLNHYFCQKTTIQCIFKFKMVTWTTGNSQTNLTTGTVIRKFSYLPRKQFKRHGIVAWLTGNNIQINNNNYMYCYTFINCHYLITNYLITTYQFMKLSNCEWRTCRSSLYSNVLREVWTQTLLATRQAL